MITNSRWEHANKISDLREGREVRIKLGVREEYELGIVTCQYPSRAFIELGITKQEYIDEKARNPDLKFFRFKNSKGEIAVGSLWKGPKVLLDQIEVWVDDEEEKKLKDAKKKGKLQKPSNGNSINFQKDRFDRDDEIL
jgi:hypothetical protein